jgi:hypothetical protein
MGFANWAAVGPDGRSVDVASGNDDAVARFIRDPLTGGLTYAGCQSAETESGAVCTALPGAAPAGANTGMDGPRALTVSSDGRSLYALAGGDDAIARFDREPDAIGPVVELTGKKRQRLSWGLDRRGRAKGKALKLTAKCADELCTSVEAKATMKVRLDGKRRRASFQRVTAGEVPAGATMALAVKPKKKAKRLIKKARRGKAVVTVTASDLLGNASTAKLKVKLRR